MKITEGELPNGSGSSGAGAAAAAAAAAPEPKRDPMEEVYHRVVTHTRDGVVLAEQFKKLPSRRSMPEYYRAVESPLDLATVRW